MRRMKEAQKSQEHGVACATVVIPALNEAARIGDVVRYALSDPATAEVIVIDDSSIDDTAGIAARAGASVVTSSMLGKGASMRDGLLRAEADFIVYLDGDLAGLESGVVSRLVEPLCLDTADFVKARFGRLGGRVTELTAKPMLQVFFPELAHFAQPLGGLVAARKSLLEQLHFESGYGVDVALLIDAWNAGARLTEVDIGRLEHDSQPLFDLAAMANEVARVIHNRAKASGRLNVDQIGTMYEVQRQATATLDYILTRRKARSKILLLDMDGTVSTERFVVNLARELRCEPALSKLLDDGTDDAITRSQRIAALFKFAHREKFEKVAHALPLRSGVIAWVNRMRRQGFMVGLVSDSYFVAAEIVRRRIFADFALAHTLQFSGEVCTGDLRINTAFVGAEASNEDDICKRHVVQRLRLDHREPRIDCIWAIGDNINDIGMLNAADRSWAMAPKSSRIQSETKATIVESFEALLTRPD